MFQTVQTLGFPVFCLGFSPNGKLLLGGGGGATKAGVKNTCQLYTLDESTGSLSLVAEQEFSKADDGCMSLAVHPLVLRCC